MKLTWYGHSCFLLECNDGIIVFDPYKNKTVPGLKDLSLKAHLVLCSHDHSDHCGIENVTIQEKHIEYDFIDSYHDDQKGKLRGFNRIHIIQSEDMKVVHLGDIGCFLDDYQKIAGCDVLMIPVGGYYTINSQQALEMIHQIQPRIVIPMHYRSDHFGYDGIDTIDSFIKNARDVQYYTNNSITVTKQTPGQIAVLKYI